VSQKVHDKFDNLPDGFHGYEIIDHDTKESATDWLDEEEND
jgi:hypothetical protein